MSQVALTIKPYQLINTNTFIMYEHKFVDPIFYGLLKIDIIIDS